MNWATLEAARHSLGHTQQAFADLLGVALSTYKGWGQRGKIPRYIANSVGRLVGVVPGSNATNSNRAKAGE